MLNATVCQTHLGFPYCILLPLKTNALSWATCLCENKMSFSLAPPPLRMRGGETSPAVPSCLPVPAEERQESRRSPQAQRREDGVPGSRDGTSSLHSGTVRWSGRDSETQAAPLELEEWGWSVGGLGAGLWAEPGWGRGLRDCAGCELRAAPAALPGLSERRTPAGCGLCGRRFLPSGLGPAQQAAGAM